LSRVIHCLFLFSCFMILIFRREHDSV
jgi:hypothetical protein